MHMPHLSRRTQILLDEERYARLSAEAESRGASVAGLIREAIDQTFPVTSSDRRAAATEFLRLADDDPMVDLTPEEIRSEIISINERTPAPVDGRSQG